MPRTRPIIRTLASAALALPLLAACGGPAAKPDTSAMDRGLTHAPANLRQGYYVALGDGKEVPLRLFVYTPAP